MPLGKKLLHALDGKTDLPLAFAAGLLDRYEPCTPYELIRVFDWTRIPREDVTLDLQ